MSPLRFDGRVAIVTGAGRGIGRGYARLLAERGASVVVNDLGGSIEGVGADAGPASSVAAEIVAAGGVAVADTNDVAGTTGAQALVESAVERFGQVDILVNNAGIIRWARVEEADAEVLAQHVAVHLAGSFDTTRAAWPHMVERHYGRVVMTTSTGMFGLPGNLSYAAAKGGVVGLTRNFAVEGAEHGIRANAIAPAAVTRMAGQSGEDPTGAVAPQMAPEMVAPMVAYLAHEDCPVTGEIYVAGFGRFARLFIASTEGYVQRDGAPTIEDVAAHWTAINDERGYAVPTDLNAWSAAFTAHLREA